jgi:hypothetical protein
MPNITFDLGGSGVKADTFLTDLLRNKDEKNKVKVPLPQVGEVKLEIPPFFAQQDAKGKWRLVNPLTLVRNLATRKGKKSITISRENVENPNVEANGRTPAPPLSAFSQRDQNRIVRYFKGVQSGSAGDYQYKNKQRGFPATLYKNARKAGLTEDPNTKTYAKNKKKAKAPYIPKPPRPPPRGRDVVLQEDFLDRLTRQFRGEQTPRVDTPPPSPPPSPRRADTPPPAEPEPEPESPKGTKDDEWWDDRIEKLKELGDKRIGYMKANPSRDNKNDKRELTNLYKDYFGSLRGEDKKVAEKKVKPVLDELFKKLDYYSSAEYEEELDKKRQVRSAKRDELNELYEDLAERANSAMSAGAEKKFKEDYKRASNLREELDLSDYEKDAHRRNRNKAVVKYNQLKGKGLNSGYSSHSDSSSSGEDEPHDPDGGALFAPNLERGMNERSMGIQPSQTHSPYSDMNLNERSMGLGVRRLGGKKGMRIMYQPDDGGLNEESMGMKPETDGMEAGSLFSMVKDFVSPAKKKAPLEQTLSNKELQDLLAKSYEEGLGDYGDYKVDRELSNPITQVYYNPQRNQPVIVHRGSAEGQDWRENVEYGLLNKKTGTHFKTAEDTQRRAEAKYGTDNLTTIGHSKGAIHAEDFGQRGRQIITLNKPVSPYDLISKRVPENQIDIKTSGDPVSALRGLQFGNQARVLESKSSNPLAEHSVNVLEGTGFLDDLFRRLAGRRDARIAPTETELHTLPSQTVAPPSRTPPQSDPDYIDPQTQREIQRGFERAKVADFLRQKEGIYTFEREKPYTQYHTPHNSFPIVKQIMEEEIAIKKIEEKEARDKMKEEEREERERKIREREEREGNWGRKKHKPTNKTYAQQLAEMGEYQRANNIKLLSDPPILSSVDSSASGLRRDARWKGYIH